MTIIKMTKYALTLILLFLLNACAIEQNMSSKPQPNIVVFIVDDMGPMDTSVSFVTDSSGQTLEQPLNNWYHTPNMEKLAANGTRFSQFYAQSVCSPSRSSLLTGQNAARHHTTTWINPTKNNKGEFGPSEWNWNGLDSDSITFPRLLQNQGYRTIHIGKGHFGPLLSEGENPKNIGFDVNIAGSSWGRPKSYYGQNHYGNHAKYKKRDNTFTHNIPHLSEYHGKDVFLTEALTLEANKQIERAVEDDKPFLLYMSHYAVHDPFDSDPRFASRYNNRGYSKRAQAFATLIEGMDKSLGDIVKKLSDLNVADNTIIILLGDNGSDAPLGKNDEIASSAPLRGKKGTSWEGGMRAPLIISWAELKAGSIQQANLSINSNQTNTNITTIMDIFPTILSVTNTPKPENAMIDGESLMPALAGQINTPLHNEFLMHFPHSHRHSYFTTYRQGDWKLIYQYNPEGNKNVERYQLYNLAKDPNESNNLASTEKGKLADMVKAMRYKLKEQNAQYPISSNGTELEPELPN